MCQEDVSNKCELFKTAYQRIIESESPAEVSAMIVDLQKLIECAQARYSYVSSLPVAVE